MGSMRVVIEPIESEEKRGGPLTSSWVPGEQRGNDRNHWEPFVFPIGRISLPFHILLEVVPPRGYYAQRRGHVSIDNLVLKGCFHDDGQGGACSLSDVRCKRAGKDVCIKPNGVCDINNDCDGGADEQVNCGMFPLFSFIYFCLSPF